MSGQVPKETIRLVVLDSVLFGAARALEYLDTRGQVMMDKIGEGIVDYCYRAGYVEKSGDLQQLAFKFGNFFTQNGYVGNLEFGQDGDLLVVTFPGWRYLGLMKRLRKQENYLLACPMCLANNALFRSNSLYGQVVYEKIAPDGTFLRKYKVTPATSDSAPEALNPPELADLKSLEYNGGVQVGLHAFEAVEYGLAHGLDYLGTQAQLLLDNVGRGVIEFLKEESKLKSTGDLNKDLELMASFFESQGLADDIQVTLSSSEVRAEFRNYRYEPVLRRLLDEEFALTSCPFTLAARALLRDDGWALGGMTWDLLGGRNCSLTISFLRGVDQEFDEDKTSALMDTV